MHLRYSLLDAHMNGEIRHAQDVMRELGITYQHATPQSMSDSWWFWNCGNVPAELPSYLTELKAKPHDCIGWGIDEKIADAIEAARERGAGGFGSTGT